jgi:hypothetical protein
LCAEMRTRSVQGSHIHAPRARSLALDDEVVVATSIAYFSTII